MNSDIEILKGKIENFSPELIEVFKKIVENIESVSQNTAQNFYCEEILYRMQFHTENPQTKLDFFENITELEKNCA